MTSVAVAAPEFPFPRTGEVRLPAHGGSVNVPTYRARLAAWTGPRLQLERTRHEHPIFAHRGRPLFAELAILRRLQEAGFHGVWVDAIQGAMRVDLPGVTPPVTLPPERGALLARIAARRGQPGGLWGLHAWRDGEPLFLECIRRPASVRLSDSKLEWASAALALGVEPSSFGVIEVLSDGAAG